MNKIILEFGKNERLCRDLLSEFDILNYSLSRNIKYYHLLLNSFMSEEMLRKNIVQMTINDKYNLIKLSNEIEIILECLNDDLIINIGARNKDYELYKGRSGGSYHSKYMAVDFKPLRKRPVDLYNTILALMNDSLILRGGLKKYNTFCHYDIRGKQVLF